MEADEIKTHLKDRILDYYVKKKIKWKDSDTTDFSLLLVDYFEVLRKHIPPRRRKVYIAPELMQKIDTPQYAGWKKRFYEIKEKFENGDDMNNFLSKRADENGFKDRMLTCWKMHHVHFYPEKKKGDMLLFAVIMEDRVYMVDVLPHNKKYVFSTFDLLNIVHSNWREIFEPYRLRGITDVEPVITKDEDIDKLRKAGISTAVQLGEDVYALDMMAADGHNAMDVMYANKICNSLALNEIEGIFQPCRFEEVSLTYKMHPCFVLTYYNALGERAQWSI